MSGNTSESTDAPVSIRAEAPADWSAVRAINTAAFPTPGEADLVDALRGQAEPLVSLVAESGAEIVGHILFSPVTLSGSDSLRLMGLAPMAVRPDRQRDGIGSQLVHAGLAACRDIGAVGCVVLGHPQYYPRFGFTPADEFAIRCEFEVPAEAFMALELEPDSFPSSGGTIHYHRLFSEL